jgi:flagellar motility protein MotE (MotC chaperone)
MMRAKYMSGKVKDIVSGDEDDIILQVFAKNQVLGSTRNDACSELREVLKRDLSDAALKLRFYRLIQKRGLDEDAIYQLGQQVIHKMGMELPESSQRNTGKRAIKSLTSVMPEQPKMNQQPTESLVSTIDEPFTPSPKVKEDGAKDENHQTFLYQLAQLPEVTRRLEERVEELHKAQRYQLDLRGFIEHLLDVERNMKKEDRLMEEIDRLNTDIAAMQNEITREKDKLERREKELIEVYKVFNSMLTDFMNLESVAKLTSLGDFMKRLEVTVDQFGTVLKSRRI